MKKYTLVAILALLNNLPSFTFAGIGNDNAPQGGTFYQHMSSEPETLNPITSQDYYAQIVHGYLLESLLIRNIETYAWQPYLAEKYEVSKDGKVYTFKLRSGLAFHDGTPITSQDVKFSFDVIFLEGYPTAHLRPYYEGIEKVEIIDPLTVKFYAKEKYFKNFEVAAGITVLPKHIYGDKEKALKMNKEVHGSGPYQIESYDKGKRITLKKQPAWWGSKVSDLKGMNNFEKVVFRFVSDPIVALEMLKKEEIDYQDFSPETFEQRAVGPEWGTKLSKIKAQNFSSKGFGYIGWNLENPLFKDKKVRIALASLMDRREMIKKFRYGLSLPATGPWFQQSEYASKKAKPLEFDPPKAIQLLKEAGWSDSNKDGILDKTENGARKDFKFTILFGNPDNEKYLTGCKETAKKAGVEIEVNKLEWNALMKIIDERKFEALNISWSGGSIDLDPKQVWHSASATASGSNFVNYKNPEVDKLIDQARGILDKNKRIPLLQKVYEKIADDAPYLFLFNDTHVLYGHTRKIQKPKDTFKFSVGTDFWWAKP
jgi:microcin C transport system substrate-binding protein